MKRTPLMAVLGSCLCAWLLPNEAQAWDWFRSESSDVARGNQLLGEKKYDDALTAYDQALRNSPDDPGVQLDRGTALLGAKKHGPAREALRSASRGHVEPEIRSRALYNLGLSFLDEADTLGKADNLDEAQARLRESVDAFKASLRARPGNADAAWNLDLARRRLVDVEKKQEQKKEDEKDKDDQQKKEDDNKKDDQNKNEQTGDAGAGDENDGGSPEDAGADSGSDNAGADAAARDAGAGKDAGGDDDDARGDASAQKGNEGAPREAQENREEPPRDAMERALDALRDSEENLQKQRANARARQRPQRVLKDW